MSHCTGTNPANLWRNRSLRFAPCRSSPTVCARSEGWGVAKGFRRSCQRAQTLCKVRTYASWSAHDPARTARGRGPTLPPSTRKLGHPRCAARHPAARGPGGMEPPGARRHALHRPAAASPELAASCPSSSSPTPPAAAISVPAAPRTARTARTPVSAAGRACVPRNRSVSGTATAVPAGSRDAPAVMEVALEWEPARRCVVTVGWTPLTANPGPAAAAPRSHVRPLQRRARCVSAGRRRARSTGERGGDAARGAPRAARQRALDTVPTTCAVHAVLANSSRPEAG